MRIAACLDLTPRKLGSLEQWILAFAEACQQRGHQVHFFWHEPVHPTIAARLRELGVGWTALDRLETAPLRGSRELRRSFDVVYLNLIAPRSGAALAAFLAWPIPVLYFDQISGPLRGQGKRSRVGRLLDPLTFARVSGFAGCSRYVTERDQRRFWLDPQRCCTIHNGVDPERFIPGTRNGGEDPVLLTVAYLIAEKGVDVLISACAKIAELPWRLIIVGDGPDAPKLRALAAEAGLASRIEFAGLRDDVDEYLQSADVFVHPALWEEAFGLTITEAMASGCATVASRVGGVPEIIEDRISGCLVPPGDSSMLATALRELLGDRNLRRQLGTAARQRVLERFTLSASVTGQLEWIERLGRPAP